MLNDENLSTMASRLYDLFAAGILSVLGGSAAYTYKTVKEDTGFSLKHFFINAFLAFFIGNMVGNFLPPTAQYRDGILMLAGFSTWPILGIMEFYGRRVIVKWLDKKLGVNEGDKAIADQQKAEERLLRNKKPTTSVPVEEVVQLDEPVHVEPTLGPVNAISHPTFVVGTTDKTQRS